MILLCKLCGCPHDDGDMINNVCFDCLEEKIKGGEDNEEHSEINPHD